MASLVAFGILELVPISDPEHVILSLVYILGKIDDSRFIVLPSLLEGFLFSKLFPIIECRVVIVILTDYGIETRVRYGTNTWRDGSSHCSWVERDGCGGSSWQEGGVAGHSRR